MDSEQIELHVMSLISIEMKKGMQLIDACRHVNNHIKTLMPSMQSQDMVNRALALMIELGRINECPVWE